MTLEIACACSPFIFSPPASSFIPTLKGSNGEEGAEGTAGE